MTPNKTSLPANKIQRREKKKEKSEVERRLI